MIVAVVAIKIRVPPSWWISSSGRTILSHGYRGSARQQAAVRPIRADLVMISSKPILPHRKNHPLALLVPKICFSAICDGGTRSVFD